MKFELIVIYNDGMTSIIPTLATHHHIRFFREKINNLSLPFISPLNPYYYDNTISHPLVPSLK
jgi:hypothetical protein